MLTVSFKIHAASDFKVRMFNLQKLSRNEFPIQPRSFLLGPRKRARIRNWTAIVEQAFQLMASIGIRDGPMKWIPLKFLTMKRT